MVCPVPLIPLPGELIQVDSLLSEDLSRLRRDTASEDGGDWHWQLLGRLWNFVQTARWQSPPRRLSRQKRAPVGAIKSTNASMSLYLGFIMDKLTSLRNISKTKPNLRLEFIPFNFTCDSADVTFNPAVNPLIKIKVINSLV